MNPFQAQSLYVHFPFCESKCHYCDFYSIGRERMTDSMPIVFEQALRRECELVAGSPTLDLPETTPLTTVFFGGGTPSMTPPESMFRALEPLQLQRRRTLQTEWTLEANPSSIAISRSRLEEYLALGVNRVSMGVQAMKDSFLTMMGRVHSQDDVKKALDLIFQSGFNNVSVDLLCGVPDQSLKDLDHAIDELLAFPITHLSCYLLTLTRGNKLYDRLPNEEVQLEHLLHIDRRMTAAGFDHYEISNFARPGLEARHNLAYWKGQSYLGLGPSAHSFDATESKRWKNVSSLEAYSARLQRGERPIEWCETLSEHQQTLEKWMLALRLSEGIPKVWLNTPSQMLRAEKLLETGHLENHPQIESNYRLTPLGFALSDQILQMLAPG